MKFIESLITSGTGVSSNRGFSLILVVALLAFFILFTFVEIPEKKMDLITNNIVNILYVLIGGKGVEKVGQEIASAIKKNGNGETK